MNYLEIMETFMDYVKEIKPKLSSPQAVNMLMRPLLVEREQEEFHVLCLTPKLHLINSDTLICKGLVDRCNIHPREVFRKAILCNASSIILAHNHPSGDQTPSPADKKVTHELIAAGKLLQIPVNDHVVIGNGYFSMQEEGIV